MEKNIKSDDLSLESIFNRLVFSHEINFGLKISFEKSRLKPGMFRVSLKVPSSEGQILAQETVALLVKLRFAGINSSTHLLEEIIRSGVLPLVILPKNCLENFVGDLRKFIPNKKVELLISKLEDTSL